MLCPKDLVQRPGVSSLSLRPPPPPPPGASRVVPLLPLGTPGVPGWARQRSGGTAGLRGGKAGRPNEGTGAKWGAQVTLPASSRSLQPSADTQQRAGGGVRAREGKGRKRGKAGAVVVLRNQRPRDAWPRAGPAPGLGGARVGRSALAPPRPMARGSHPGRRRVRGRAQRRSGCQASCPPASLCLTPAHPHQCSPVETAQLRSPAVLERIL
jgi:hypothetical protein